MQICYKEIHAQKISGNYQKNRTFIATRFANFTQNLYHIFSCKLNLKTVLQVAKYIPRIFPWGDSNINILSENFPKLLKKNPVFRARLAIRSFLLKLKVRTVFFELIFLKTTWRTTFAYKYNLIFKAFLKLYLMESLSN